jgi:anhydro-N-acetylmuramic acid kinase
MIAAHLGATGSGFAGGLADQLATACLAAALTIGMSFDLFLKGWRQWEEAELLVSGGGTQNRYLMKLLDEQLIQPSKMRPGAVDAKWSQAKEAIAFALLGAATLDGVASNVPSCTGARRGVVLGSITPRPYNRP